MENNWISVKDDLPGFKERVLVYNANKRMDGLHHDYRVAEIRSINEEGPLWYITNNFRTHGFTHWMPLPEPPELDK